MVLKNATCLPTSYGIILWYILKEYKIFIGYDLFSETTLYLILYLFHGKSGSMYIVHIPKHIIWHTQTFFNSHS